jgi:hypothetical protein
MKINITQIERCLPENIIMEVWFNANKTVGGITVNLDESIKFMRGEDSPIMVEYIDVTMEMVLSWINATDLEERLDNEITKLNNPATAMGLPWE